MLVMPMIRGRRVRSHVYGYLPDGQEVHQYTLSNARGMRVTIINYGAIITGIYTKDKHGFSRNRVLAYDNLESYLHGSSYLGAVVGRVANRISLGRFELNESRYSLATNNGPNHLHGGEVGYDRRLWSHILSDSSEDGATLHLSLVSEDGDQGYPGELHNQVIYTLTDDNSLRVEYLSQCHFSATPINLTQHSYFNLSGKAGAVSDHELKIFSDSYTPVDEAGIPTGEIQPVAKSVFDFTESRKLSDALTSGAQEINVAGGIDCNFVVRRERQDNLQKVAVLKERKVGCAMTVWSTQPGVQVYTGNYLHKDSATSQKQFKKQSGVCLECQGFPDAVNQPGFPSVIVYPGDEYNEVTCYSFSSDF